MPGIAIDDIVRVTPASDSISSITIDNVEESIISDDFPSLDRVPTITIHDGVKQSPSSGSIPSITIEDDIKVAPSSDSIPSITIKDEDFEANSSVLANSQNQSLPTFLSAVLEEVLKDATLPKTNSTQTLPDSNSIQATPPDNVASGYADEAQSDDDMLSTIHECKICDNKFDFRSDLLKHYRGHERDKKSMTCTFCSTIFHSTVELLIHRKQHEKCGGVSKDVSAASTGVVRRRRSR